MLQRFRLMIIDGLISDIEFHLIDYWYKCFNITGSFPLI